MFQLHIDILESNDHFGPQLGDASFQLCVQLAEAFLKLGVKLGETLLEFGIKPGEIHTIRVRSARRSLKKTQLAHYRGGATLDVQ